MPEPTNGLREQVRVHDSELARMRDRSHAHGNKLAEHDAEIEGVGRTLQRLDLSLKDIDAKIERRFNSLEDATNKRFDKLAGQGWKITGAILSAMTLAAVIVGIVIT